jgi:hypothetical protein
MIIAAVLLTSTALVVAQKYQGVPGQSGLGRT